MALSVRLSPEVGDRLCVQDYELDKVLTLKPEVELG